MPNLLVDRFNREAERHPRLPYLLMALAALVVIVYFYPHPSVSHYKYEEGRPWNYAQLIAPFDIPIHPDSASVAASLDSLNASFVPVYSRLSFNVDSVMRIARSRMNAIAKPGEEGAADDNTFENAAGFAQALSNLLNTAYSRGVLADSLPESLGTTHRAKVRMRHGNVLQTFPATRMLTRSRLLNMADSLALSYRATRRLQNSGLAAMIRPSVVCDVEESERILNNERAMITIDRGVIQRGQTIIDKGSIITPQDFTNLRTYEDMLESQMHETQRSDLLILLGQTLYVALVLMAFLFYIYLNYGRKAHEPRRTVGFLLGTVTLFFLICVGFNSWMHLGIYIVPLAMIPVLVTAFFDGRLALMTAATTILLCAGVTRYPLEFVMMEFTACCAAIYSVGSISKRSQLIRASIYVAVAYWLSYLALQLMMNGSFDDFSWSVIACLTVNAALISIGYVFMFPIERTFGFVSDVTLMELADTNAPVLRELSEECPGTFQHCVAVSTLATDAARATGANELLVRAGAMYHDIGKMGNPMFFTENQHGVNPHDGLTPERSAEIITGHVADGLRRAEKAHLPGVIRDFIREHHGRGRAKYFYFTACQKAGDTPVDPTPYTYPGPNPRSVETSILMMADSVEAASRSLAEHTPQAITALVDKIIDGQIADGLHNDSQLSFRDVSLIKAAFIKRLKTMYHSRIAYPDAPKKA